MPTRLVERYARHLVSDLRRLTPDTCAWSDDEDAYLSAPLGVRYAYALADLLEYFLDTEGPAGVDEMRAVLHTCEALLPSLGEPCACAACTADSDHSRSASALNLMGNIRMSRYLAA